MNALPKLGVDDNALVYLGVESSVLSCSDRDCNAPIDTELFCESIT